MSKYLVAFDSETGGFKRITSAVAALFTLSEVQKIIEDQEDTVFSVSGQDLSWVNDNTVKDIMVFKNMGRLFQATDGTIGTGDFKKVSSTEIELLFTPQSGDKITISAWKISSSM